MPTLSIYIDNEDPNHFKVATINLKDEKAYISTYNNENEVLDKVKDFLSKNKVKNKLYTGDILFVSKAPDNFTPNKIYHIKDGIIKDNFGNSFPYYENIPLKSLEDVKEYFSTEGRRIYFKSRYSLKTYTLIEVAP